MFEAAVPATEVDIAATPYSADSDLKDYDLKDALSMLGNIEDETARDFGNQIIPAEYMIQTDRIHTACALIVAAGKQVMMVGAQTSATHNFKVEHAGQIKRITGLIAVQPRTLTLIPGPESEDNSDSGPTSSDTIFFDREANGPLRSNQIYINSVTKIVRAGAGVTPDQINQVLARYLGPQFFVPLDLTTADTAQLGGVAACNAQGPGRIQLHEVAKSLTVTTGRELIKLNDPDRIKNHTGLKGLTGGIVEVELKILERPENPYFIFVALKNANEKNWPDKAAELMRELYPAIGHVKDGKMVSAWSNGHVIGLEQITDQGLDNLLEIENPKHHGSAQKYKELLTAAGSQMGFFISGYSEFDDLDHMMSEGTSDDELEPHNPLKILLRLAEKGLIDENMLPVVGRSGYKDMLNFREAIPLRAKDDGKTPLYEDGKVFSISTDINNHPDPKWLKTATPDNLQTAFRLMLDPYLQFETAIADLTKEADTKGIEIKLTRYGHFNPKNVNQHTRVTMKNQAEAKAGAFAEIKGKMEAIRNALFRALTTLRDEHKHIVVEVGEKGKVTADATALMTPESRNRVIKTIAAGPVEFQAHLPQAWKMEVVSAREQILTQT